MKIARIFNKAFVGLSIVFLAACGYPSHKLGRDAENPGLRGETKTEVMFRGAGASNHLILPSDSLKSENEYTYNGSLTILGDVPANTDIEVYNGKLHITGSVGEGSEIETNVPVTTHQESYTYYTTMTIGKTTTMVPHTGYRTVIDGYYFSRDTGPSVVIDGGIANKVEITTNRDLVAAGKVITKCQSPVGKTTEFSYK